MGMVSETDLSERMFSKSQSKALSWVDEFHLKSSRHSDWFPTKCQSLHPKISFPRIFTFLEY